MLEQYELDRSARPRHCYDQERMDLFPAIDRVIYRKNPLIEVVSQVRFPQILRIDAELPTAFQERIREDYPEFNQSAQVPEVQGLPPTVAAALRSSPGFSARMAFEFMSADGIWKVTLNRDFLALTTSQYTKWEDFRHRLLHLLDALVKTYAPPYYSRIGLRYRDAIQRSVLGLDDTDWSALLIPEIASILTARTPRLDIPEAIGRFSVGLPDYDGRLGVTHGLATNEDTKEVGYLIDADFFTHKRTQPTEAVEILDDFNREAGRFFRWCITDQLHKAMQPEHPE